MWAKYKVQQTNSTNKKQQFGFTIVELLIVIVVIGILAAIVIMAYNGMQNRARQSALTTDARQAASQLELIKSETGSYPADANGLKKSPETTYEYIADSSSYCLTVSGDGGSIYINSMRIGKSEAGPCNVGHWAFDGDVSDRSLYSNNGTVSGATLTTDRRGDSNSAYSMTPGSIIIPDSNNLDISEKMTVSFWIKLNNYGTYYAFNPARKATGTTDSNFTVYLFGDYQGNGNQGRVGFYGTAGGTWQGLTGLYRIDTGQWYHVAMSYDSSLGGQLYINGQATGARGAKGTLATNNTALTLYMSDGAMDDVRIYNKALSSEQLKQLYEFTR